MYWGSVRWIAWWLRVYRVDLLPLPGERVGVRVEASYREGSLRVETFSLNLAFSPGRRDLEVGVGLGASTVSG
jgi:hypothetical protein